MTFLDVGGKRVEALFVGDGTPSLVFLHEGLGSVPSWREFPARVANATGRAALVYSRFGYGTSDGVTLPRPLDYMEREANDVLPKVLDAAGVSEAILVGHSDGASIAIVAAASEPRVRGLVLEAPHVFVEDVSVASIARATEAYTREGSELRARLAKHHADVDTAFWGWNRAWLDPAFRAWNIEAYLPRVRVSVLVVQGEDDPYGTRAQVDAIARGSGGPVEVVMLPRCGHAPHREAPEATLDAVVRLVRSIPRGD